MSRVYDIVAGLIILAKYDPDVAAEHDIIYAGNDAVSLDDAKVLESLGWSFDEAFSCWSVLT